MPWSGSRQTAVAHSAWALDQGPQSAGQALAPPRVEEDRVEGSAEDVVLTLIERAVADPHGLCSGVPTEVRQRDLGEISPPVDPVHDLQTAVGVRLQLGDVLHELVGLAVQVEPMQRAQREGGVAQPAVSVVPVPFAAWGFRQRGREGGDGRAGRHVGETLDRQRRALDGVAISVVGNPGSVQPCPPEADGGVDARLRVVEVFRRRVAVGPRQRAEDPLAGAEGMAGAGPAALDIQGQVGAQPENQIRPAGVRGVAAGVHQRPAGFRLSVIEDRLTDQLHLHLAFETLRRAHEEVLGVVVGRRPGVRRDRCPVRDLAPSSTRP